MSANAGPPPTRAGDCIYCARTKQVRTYKPPGQHPAVQACHDCRPAHEPVQPRKFAVLLGLYSYIVQAHSREAAERLVDDEVKALADETNFVYSPVWDASKTLAWRAAWRRNAVVQITDRKLPEGIE